MLPRSIRPRTVLCALLALLVVSCGGVVEPPATSISASPAFLSFDGTSAATVTVTADGRWTLASDSPWLKVDRTSGAAGSTEVTVTIDRTGLSPELYAGELTLSGSSELSSVVVSMRFPTVSGNVVDPEGDVSMGSRAPMASARRGPTASERRESEVIPGEYLVLLSEDMARVLEARASGASLQAVRPGLETFKTMANGLAGDHGLAVRSQVKGTRLPVMTVKGDAAAAARLASDGRVRIVEPNFRWSIPRVGATVLNAEHDFGPQWHYEDIRLAGAWEFTQGSEDVVVAVIDGGFATQHEYLAANLLPGYDFAFGDADPSADDVCVEHGTHVAGTVAALHNAVESVVGVAPGVRLRPVRVGFFDNGECALTGDGILDAITWVAGYEVEGVPQIPPVDVVNMSLGGGYSSVLEVAVAALLDAGVSVVAASGNQGHVDYVLYPAAYDGVIGVGATNVDESFTWYTNAGPEVDVVAPGGEVYKDDETGGVLSLGWNLLLDTEDYVYMMGTSMATPHVAGVVALMLSVNPGLSPADVVDLVRETARDLGAAGFDWFYGYGMVDAGEAVAAAAAEAPPRFSHVTVRLLSGGTVAASAKASASGTFDLGQVAAGTYTIEAGTDRDRDGSLDDAGEFYASTTVTIDYTGDVTVDLDVSPR